MVKGGTLAIAMSEPEAGSDVANLKTRARLEDGEWVLDGSKMWCSYAHKASEILIVCRTGAGERHEDLSMIFVPRDADGPDRSRRSRRWAARRPTSSTSTACACPRRPCSAPRAAAGSS